MQVICLHLPIPAHRAQISPGSEVLFSSGMPQRPEPEAAILSFYLCCRQQQLGWVQSCGHPPASLPQSSSFTEKLGFWTCVGISAHSPGICLLIFSASRRHAGVEPHFLGWIRWLGSCLSPDAGLRTTASGMSAGCSHLCGPSLSETFMCLLSE